MLLIGLWLYFAASVEQRRRSPPWRLDAKLIAWVFTLPRLSTAISIGRLAVLIKRLDAWIGCVDWLRARSQGQSTRS